MSYDAANMDKEKLVKHAHGCLMGVAVGDAMGMPTSLYSPERVKREFPERIINFLPAPVGHPIHDKMVAGEITDDTQQTLKLADAFIQDKKFTAERVAENLLQWAEDLQLLDGKILGPSSIRALKQIRDGESIENAGWMGDTNGAAMRVSPVGIAHPGDFAAVVKEVAEACKPTHNTNIAIAGASGVACAVASGMVSDSIEDLLEAYYYGIREGIKFGNEWYGSSIFHRTEMALEIVRSGKSESEVWSDLYNYVGAGVTINESIPTSIGLVMYYKGDPIKVIQGATNMGGDCDTVAAIAGSMAGAFAGIDAFPKHMQEKIEEVNHLGLGTYAEKMVAGIIERDSVSA